MNSPPILEPVSVVGLVDVHWGLTDSAFDPWPNEHFGLPGVPFIFETGLLTHGFILRCREEDFAFFRSKWIAFWRAERRGGLSLGSKEKVAVLGCPFDRCSLDKNRWAPLVQMGLVSCTRAIYFSTRPPMVAVFSFSFGPR